MKHVQSLDRVIDNYQRRLAEMPTWTKEKRQLVQDLEDHLSAGGYDWIRTNRDGCFGLTGLGNDKVQKISSTKRGYLSSYRGQIVRIVCVGPGRYKRSYRVGPTKRKPTIIDQSNQQ